MSFSINFEVVEDEDGSLSVVPGHVSPGTPVGPYSVGGHVAMSDQDWGESVSVTTPIGYASSSSISQYARKANAERNAALKAARNG